MEWWGFSKKERGAIILILFIVTVSLALKYSGILSVGIEALDDDKIARAVKRLQIMDSLDSTNKVLTQPSKPAGPGTFASKSHKTQRKDYFKVNKPDSFTYSRSKWQDQTNNRGAYKTNKVTYKHYSRQAQEPIDVNTADTTQLKTIRGIGSYFSAKIVSHRMSLGGYHNLSQLMEIYKMDSSKLSEISKFLIVADNVPLKTLSINESNVEQLGHHPYISLRQAKKIIKFKEQHGDFETKKDLLNIVTLDSVWLNRVEMYLTL